MAQSRIRVPFFIFVLGVLSSILVTQEKPPGLVADKPAQPVSVSFFVEDRQGNPIAIAASDLTILDDKRAPQSVQGMKPEREMPLRLGLLVDKSFSERSSRLYQPELTAASDMLRVLLAGPDDRAMVVPFDVVPKATEFLDHNQIKDFNLNVTPSGGTALYDAVYWACRERMKPDKESPARHILVVLSDGEDNLSHVTLAEAISSALKTRTMIFAISTDGSGHSERGDHILQMLAEQTGGNAFFRLSPKEVPKVFDKLKAEMAVMYRVTYVPGVPGKAGTFQHIDFRVGEKRKVFFPRGYYAASEGH